MKARFEKESGHRILVDALKDQKLVNGNIKLAEDISAVGELLEVKRDAVIIEQGAADNDVFLILTGSFAISVNGRQVAIRRVGDHVGEMAAIQPTQRRSATVIALEDAVVLKMTEAQLADLGRRYPEIFRCLAKELARRLEQRNALVTATRSNIRVFIVCSVEALDIARSIQNAFEHDPFSVVVWTDGVFLATHYPIESLEREVDQSDFAIAIAQPDDITTVRGAAMSTPRDNVIFELGFFMGRLGRHRALLVEPRGEEVKLPSDLSGLTTISYKFTDPKQLAVTMAPACNRIREIILDLGPNN
jgi:predicted nucleotide-binding protein